MASMNFDYDLLERLPAPCAIGPHDGYQPEQELANEAYLEPRKNRYKPGVLVGHWYERRAEYRPPPDDWSTVYDLAYTCKNNADLVRDRRLQYDIKTKSEGGVGSEFLFEYPGSAFRNNYSTTYELFYRHLPEGLCGPQKRKYTSRKDVWVPELDLTKNYGNLGDLGLKEYIDCEAYMESTPSPRESFQKKHYVAPESSAYTKRIPRPKADFRTPFLCHLDIDPSLPFRPHLVRSKTMNPVIIHS